MKERRHFSRVKFVTDVIVQSEDQRYEGELVDISLNGALFHTRNFVEIEPGDTCELSFSLTSSDVHLTFKSLLVHAFNGHLGFKFISEDIETVAHLRRLLELNLGDCDQISHELSFLMAQQSVAV